MKKFLAVFNGLEITNSTLDYAIFLAQKANAHLVGVFLNDIATPEYELEEKRQFEGSYGDRITLQNNEHEERENAVDLFRHASEQAGVSCAVHRDRNVALHELLHESVYSDLLIINRGESIGNHEEKYPSGFIKELLSDVQCPVVVVPDDYHPVGDISLLYDGGPSSVFAVKMFSYVFSCFKSLPTEVISVKDEADTLHVPDHRLIKEFMIRHYPDAEYTVLRGTADEKILECLEKKPTGTLIVLGAYQRSRMSRFFRQSMADRLMKNMDAPLFIAHNKS